MEVLEYFHSQNIAHRDIKPENFFLNQYNHIKLEDFGLSSKFQDQQLPNMKCGSLTFFSPEILSNSEFDPFKADILALGISFYFMVTGHFPYENRNNQNLRDMIVNSQIRFNSWFGKWQRKILYLDHQQANYSNFLFFSKRTLEKSTNLFLCYHHLILAFKEEQVINLISLSKIIIIIENGVQNEAVLSNSKKLMSIRSFKSFNFNINLLKHNCQHFVKYD